MGVPRSLLVLLALLLLWDAWPWLVLACLVLQCGLWLVMQWQLLVLR